MYKVIRYFNDLQDAEHAYNAGDTYPREGVSPSEERIRELASDKNAQGTPLIAEEGPAPEPVQPEEEQPEEDKKNKKSK